MLSPIEDTLKKFVLDENYARINKIGMWSMEFDYPWDYRKAKKN